MLTKQTILIIGTGNAAKVMTSRLANGNFTVLLCDKDFTKAEAVVKEMTDNSDCRDLEAMQCTFDGAWEADIIIFAVDFQEQKEVARLIREVVNQKILISAELPAGRIDGDHSPGSCEAKVLQELLPNTRIVRIFGEQPGQDDPANNIKLPRFLIAGNDDCTVDTVTELFGSAGFNVVRSKQPGVESNAD